MSETLALVVSLSMGNATNFIAKAAEVNDDVVPQPLVIQKDIPHVKDSFDFPIGAAVEPNMLVEGTPHSDLIESMLILLLLSGL